MTTHIYPLRAIPPELWRRAKIRSAETGTPIREMLLEGLELWLDRSDSETARKPPSPGASES